MDLRSLGWPARNLSMSLMQKIPRRVITLVALGLIVTFMVFYLRGSDFSRLRSLRLDVTLLVAAAVFAQLFRYWMVLIWKVILHLLGARKLPLFRILASIYAKSWMARYIPGTVAWIAGKIYLASTYGVSKSRLAASSFLEGGIQVVATATVSLLLFGLSGHASQVSAEVRLISIVVSLICMALLYPPVFNRILHAMFMVVKKRPPSDELKINGPSVAISFAMFAMGTFLSGSGNYFMVAAISEHVGPSMYLYIVAVFGISSAIGIATPFLPSGIGIKDGVQVVLLSIVLPKEVALAIAVFARLWQIVMDSGFLLLTEIANRWPRKVAA